MTRELAAWPPAEDGRVPVHHLNREVFMNIVRQAVRRLERLEALDKVAKPLARTVGRAVRPTVVRNLLSGTKSGSKALAQISPWGSELRGRPS
jgi:hypothetical protein